MLKQQHHGAVLRHDQAGSREMALRDGAIEWIGVRAREFHHANPVRVLAGLRGLMTGKGVFGRLDIVMEVFVISTVTKGFAKRDGRDYIEC